jgi:hypothetical protein
MICSVQSYSKDLPVTFFINGKKITDAKFYLVKNKSEGHPLNYFKGNLTIPDSIKSSFAILVIYQTECFLFPVPAPENLGCLEIYFDRRIFGNMASYKFRRSKFTFNYIFSKKYVILFCDGNVSQVVQKKKHHITLFP